MDKELLKQLLNLSHMIFRKKRKYVFFIFIIMTQKLSSICIRGFPSFVTQITVDFAHFVVT